MSIDVTTSATQDLMRVAKLRPETGDAHAGPVRSWPINGMVTDPLERITTLLLGEFVGNQILTAFTAVRLI